MNQKSQPNQIFVKEKLGLKVIMDFGTTGARKFRKRLGFKEYDVILTKQ